MKTTHQHCCFNTGSTKIHSLRIHVPLAKKCSMGCCYCGYSEDGNMTDNQFRPGTVGRIVTRKEEIREYLEEALARFPETKIIGVSGPGDPLENDSAITALIELLREVWPDKKLCLCTNGRLFFPYGQKVVDSGIAEYMTFTVNTLDRNRLPQIYAYFSGQSEIELEQHLINLHRAIQYCKQHGMLVKINIVYLQGINDTELVSICQRLKEDGADCFNLLPKRELHGCSESQDAEYRNARRQLMECGFPMTQQCQLCRADFCGI